jgi:integrase
VQQNFDVAPAMGTILARKRQDGTIGYTVSIRLKKAGKVIFSQSETFDREAAAKAWMKKRETELDQPGAFNKPEDPTLAEVIEKYNQDKLKAHGKTKDQVLRAIGRSDLGERRCSEIQSHHIIDFLKKMTSQPQTRGNYLSHLASVITVARPAWGYPIDKSVVEDARVVAVKLGIISKSSERTRRPTLDELTRLMRHYEVAEKKRADCIPMTKLILFSIFSTRRQEESCRLMIEDMDRSTSEITVRDMKNPGEKIGNDVLTQLTPEALQLIDGQHIKAGRIWPYNAGSVSSSFTRACVILGIEDLHFHDLRHEGISRLFELGWTIPQAARVSGHRSWKSLQRYSHVKQHGDKFKGWPWKPVVPGSLSRSSS